VSISDMHIYFPVEEWGEGLDARENDYNEDEDDD
jgi:hypothetical protein